MSPSLFAVHETHEVPPFVASSTSIPDSKSSASTANSPTLLTPDSLPPDARSSLGSSHPTVKFAPLPQIDPNRKRSLAPLGVPARSRRILGIRQEGGSLLWSTDPGAPEEDMEDPVMAFAKFVKRTGKTLWRRVRRGSKAASQEYVSHPAEPILDIGSTILPGDTVLWEKGQHVLEEDVRGRRASWSPSAERGTLSQNEVKQRCSGDLSSRSVVP